MAPRPAPLLLLVLVAAGPRESCFGSRLHSLKYFYTSISDQCRGLPQFVFLGYVNDQVLVHYDSNSRKFQHRVSWMKEGDRKDPEYWNKYTKILQDNEKQFEKDLEKLRTRYNHSGGFHTWQRMVSCELQGNESQGGLWQYGYDGKTFITFDKETLIWVAAEPQAQVTKRKWNAIAGLNQYTKSYLEGECIAWLKMFLSYGNEMLLRTEPTNSKFNLEIIGYVAAVLVPVCVIAGICLYRRRRNGYKAASRSDQGSNSPDQGSDQGSNSPDQGSDQGSNSSNQGSHQSMSCLLHSPSGQPQHEEGEGNMESTT